MTSRPISSFLFSWRFGQSRLCDLRATDKHSSNWRDLRLAHNSIPMTRHVAVAHRLFSRKTSRSDRTTYVSSCSKIVSYDLHALFARRESLWWSHEGFASLLVKPVYERFVNCHFLCQFINKRVQSTLGWQCTWRETILAPIRIRYENVKRFRISFCYSYSIWNKQQTVTPQDRTQLHDKVIYLVRFEVRTDRKSTY